jgi:Chlorophyll A-B binding protein
MVVRIATTVILFSHADALARGFRRAPPIKVQEEMGLSPTLSIFSIGFFDPLNIATDENFSVLREAELKHGRVCMVATIGMALSNNVLFDLDVGDLALSEPAIHAVTPTNAAEVIGLCGILETQVFVQRDPQDMPGDYGVGYFGTRDKARHER